MSFQPIQQLATNPALSQALGGIQAPAGIQAPGLTAPTIGAPSPENAQAFSSLLGNAMGEVNKVIDEVIQTSPDLMTGRLENLHDSSIAGAKAEVMLHLTTKIASKLASATTTLFQMQL